ncbi:MAG TPA: glycogen/starch synthase [Candidatus Marinimicrobia bacterium]|nr:glycogen/starch synthase [Candidatus Neomarinimicrobiota bacterium]
MSKLFYMTTEIIPFANTSSLAPFSTRVPLLLQGKGHDIRTIIPKYGYVSERKYILREVIRLREIPFEYDGSEKVLSAKSAFIPKTRVQVYFLEDNEWFKPQTNLVYKSKNGRILADNDERFAIFCKATLATLPHLFWKPDLFLCNGWQSSFVPALYKEEYASNDFYGNIKTVLLVHNMDDEYTSFGQAAFEKAGLKIPASMKKGKTNAYEAAAENADMIIALESPSNNLTEKLFKLPVVKAKKKKVVTVKVPEGETLDYQPVADKLDKVLEKLTG